jgi:phospholipase/carboxylesterase
MILSAYEVLSETYDNEAHDANSETAMLFCHGVYDPMVPVLMGRGALERMVERGNPCEWNGYRMGHEVVLDELQRIKDWLDDSIP